MNLNMFIVSYAESGKYFAFKASIQLASTNIGGWDKTDIFCWWTYTKDDYIFN